MRQRLVSQFKLKQGSVQHVEKKAAVKNDFAAQLAASKQAKKPTIKKVEKPT